MFINFTMWLLEYMKCLGLFMLAQQLLYDEFYPFDRIHINWLPADFSGSSCCHSLLYLMSMCFSGMFFQEIRPFKFRIKKGDCFKRRSLEWKIFASAMAHPISPFFFSTPCIQNSLTAHTGSSSFNNRGITFPLQVMDGFIFPTSDVGSHPLLISYINANSFLKTQPDITD